MARRWLWLAVAMAAAGCGDGASPPTPSPMPVLETWFVTPVLCGNCPGLTNVEVDRTTTPPRARLRVGTATSIRAIAKVGCGTEEPGTLRIVRWSTSGPGVASLQPSSGESAIVTAEAVGTTGITAERVLPDGSLSRGGMRDAFRADPPCTAQPELLLEVVP